MSGGKSKSEANGAAVERLATEIARALQESPQVAGEVLARALQQARTHYPETVSLTRAGRVLGIRASTDVRAHLKRYLPDALIHLPGKRDKVDLDLVIAHRNSRRHPTLEGRRELEEDYIETTLTEEFNG